VYEGMMKSVRAGPGVNPNVACTLSHELALRCPTSLQYRPYCAQPVGQSHGTWVA